MRLPDHIATLEDYLQAVKVANSKDLKKAAFMSFSRYIVSRCWCKMLYRFDHWSSCSFFDFLARVQEEHLQSQFSAHCSKPPTSTKYDTLLGGLLLGLNGGKDKNGEKVGLENPPTHVVITLGDTRVLWLE